MRRLALLTTLGLFGFSASADAAGLRLQRLDRATQPAVGSPQHGTIAYSKAPGSVTARGPGRARRTYPVPAHCTVGGAVAANVVALRCSLAQGPVMTIMNLTSAALSPPLGLPGTPDYASALGSRWAIVEGMDVSEITRRLIDWRTQRMIDLNGADPYGPRHYLDLDSAEPGRRLCAPIRRAQIGNILPTYRTLQKAGAWTLTTQRVQGPRLQRCGSRTTRTFPYPNVVLGRDFVGYIARGKVVYLDLRNGRRTSVAWPGASPPATAYPPALAAAGRRLIVSAAGAAGYTIYASRP